MSANKYVEATLTMPENMPLFNYNLNFAGLRSLMETINIQTNTNTQEIVAIKQLVSTKLPAEKLKLQEQMLNNSLKLGINSEKIIENQETYSERLGKKEEKQLADMQNFGNNLGKVTKLIEFLVNATDANKTKIESDERRHQKNIDDSFKRLDQKITLSLDSMNKNMNFYFAETNKKLAALQTDLTTHKRQTGAQFETVNSAMNHKVSQPQLKAGLTGLGQQIKSSILGDLSSDQMKRLATLNQYSTKLQQHMNESDLKIKSAKQNIKELSEKVTKALSVQSFEVEKHKIFEKLSDYKSKIDELTRKNQEFFDFRKSYYEANERTKHNMLDLEDQIKKLGEKGSSFKKMEDIGNVLQKLDPHLICQIGNQVKLHEKQLGKLEKQVTYLENQLQSARNSTSKMPEVNNGQTADLIIKMIKEYMTNLDFDNRMKRAEKDIHQISKKGDGVNELEKKIYLLSKDLDVGAIMKQIRRKSDQESTKKDFKILDSKLEKLFEFYKQTRREIQQLYKKTSRVTKDTIDNASLTTKKLFAPNCISCTTRQRPQSVRNYSRSKIDASFDESLDQIKNSMYVKGSH